MIVTMGGRAAEIIYFDKLKKELNDKKSRESEFSQEIEQLSDETQYLINEIEKWQI